MYANQDKAEVLRQFGTDRVAGLSFGQAEDNRRKYGLNKLEEQKKKGVVMLFFEQLQDPLIYILMAAIAISFF